MRTPFAILSFSLFVASPAAGLDAEPAPDTFDHDSYFNEDPEQWVVTYSKRGVKPRQVIATPFGGRQLLDVPGWRCTVEVDSELEALVSSCDSGTVHVGWVTARPTVRGTAKAPCHALPPLYPVWVDGWEFSVTAPVRYTHELACGDARGKADSEPSRQSAP
jgi:hypothetical protein